MNRSIYSEILGFNKISQFKKKDTSMNFCAHCLTRLVTIIPLPLLNSLMTGNSTCQNNPVSWLPPNYYFAVCSTKQEADSQFCILWTNKQTKKQTQFINKIFVNTLDVTKSRLTTAWYSSLHCNAVSDHCRQFTAQY